MCRSQDIEMCHFQEIEMYHFREIKTSHFRDIKILQLPGDSIVLFLEIEIQWTLSNSTSPNSNISLIRTNPLSP